MSQTVREIAKLVQGRDDRRPFCEVLGSHLDALAAHVLASTEPLGDERLQKIAIRLASEYARDWNDSDISRLLAEIRRLQGEVKDFGRQRSELLQGWHNTEADLRAQLQAATMRAEAAEGDTRMMDELQAKCGALLMEVERLKVAESFAWNSGHAKFLDAEQLADERGREVERLRAELCELYAKVSTLGVLTEKHRARIDAALTDIATPAATPPAQPKRIFEADPAIEAEFDKMYLTPPAQCTHAGVMSREDCVHCTPPAQEHPDTTASFMFLNPLDQSPMIAKTFEATRQIALEYLGREDWAGEHVTKLGIYRVEKVGEVTAPEAQR